MHAHPCIRSHERMDSSSEENEEEFFETLEDVPSSSSDAESGGEEGQRVNKSESLISSSFNAPGFPTTRYDVWKNTPGSVLERRQRLFTRMGLQLEGEDLENLKVSVDATPVGLSTMAPPTADLNGEYLDQGHKNADRGDRDVSRKKGANTPSTSAGWTMVRSRSDGTFSSRLQNEESSEGSRLVRSGATTPVSHRGDQERLSDTSGAVLRTPSAPNHMPSKPPLGGRRGNGNGSSASAEGLAARRLQFQWSKFGRFRVTDKNGNSLFDSTGSGVKATNKTTAGELETLRLPLENGTLKSVEGDVLCRIKDLDSGKEFVVNEVGHDGMWNKLKELDTGREITLEEFESSLGLSPIVQEVMRRERASGDDDGQVDAGAGSQKRRKSWLKAIKGVVKGSWEKGDHLHRGSGSDDRDGSTEKSGRKSSSATDDSQDALPVSRPVKVHTHKKATKEFTDLRLRQEIQAHQGAIWTMKFSLDGSYLATAGQDKVVRVWEVLLYNSRSNVSSNSSGELNLGVAKRGEDSPCQSDGDTKRSSKCTAGRKTVTSRLPTLFTLSENAKCAFKGHTEDILDLSWSPSQSLLSSSMDKTVRLWNVSSKVCLKIFPHNDYVTCIQFHPLDARHFLSGSLDGKVRIWNVRDPQVVNWVDLQEMVTAACYTPNGQGAVVGSYKGTCRFYKTSGNKLQLDTTFEVRSTRAKRSQGKKITGFQFVPGDKQKLLITSSDSRIRIYDGNEISSKFTGFRNTKSHIAASFSVSGRFIICASEDSRVCVWNYDDSRHEYPGQQKRFSGSYEDFSAKHVLVAIPWPGMGIPFTRSSPTDLSLSKLPSFNLKRGVSMPISSSGSGVFSPESLSSSYFEAESVITQEEASRHSGGPGDMPSSTLLENSSCMGRVSRGLSTVSDLQDTVFSDISSSSPSRSDRESCCGSALLSNCVLAQNIASNGFFGDSKGSATWPEEKLASLQKKSSRTAVSYNTSSASNEDAANGGEHVSASVVASAWGLVFVTAGLGGEIRVYQNYGLPVRL